MFFFKRINEEKIYKALYDAIYFLKRLDADGVIWEYEFIYGHPDGKQLIIKYANPEPKNKEYFIDNFTKKEFDIFLEKLFKYINCSIKLRDYNFNIIAEKNKDIKHLKDKISSLTYKNNLYHTAISLCKFITTNDLSINFKLSYNSNISYKSNKLQNTTRKPNIDVKFTNKFEEINKENLDKFYNIMIENGINEFSEELYDIMKDILIDNKRR